MVRLPRCLQHEAVRLPRPALLQRHVPARQPQHVGWLAALEVGEHGLAAAAGLEHKVARPPRAHHVAPLLQHPLHLLLCTPWLRGFRESVRAAACEGVGAGTLSGWSSRVLKARATATPWHVRKLQWTAEPALYQLHTAQAQAQPLT